MNNGDGTFAEGTNYNVGYLPKSVYGADLDGDDDIDVAVANGGDDTVSILINNGDGTFATGSVLGTGDSPKSVFAIDLDGDDNNDLAVLNSISANISVLINNGDGTFQDAVNYGAGYLPNSVFAADLDNDDYNDLVMPNQNSIVTIFLNNGDGTFQEQGNYGVGDFSTSVFAADLDGDTDNDLAVANRNTNDVSVLINLTDPTGVEDTPGMLLPKSFCLSQNYPNPFNPSTTIRFEIPIAGDVQIYIYDVQGNVIATLTDGWQMPGSYQVPFNANNLSSGIYFARLTAGDYTQTQKLVLMK
jgi:hypothetical protein